MANEVLARFCVPVRMYINEVKGFESRLIPCKFI